MTYGLILVFEEIRSMLLGDDVHGVAAPAIVAAVGDIDGVLEVRWTE